MRPASPRMTSPMFFSHVRRLASPYSSVVLGFHLGAGFTPALSDQEHRVGDHAREEQRAIEASDRPSSPHRRASTETADHHRHVEPHQLLGDDQGNDHRGDPEDEEHVEDVAADHVAEGDVGLARRRPTAR